MIDDLKNDELIKFEINQVAVLNQLFEQTKDDSSGSNDIGISVKSTHSYFNNTFDFIEVDLDIDYFSNNYGTILNRAKSRYLIILADLLRINGFSIKKAKLIITEARNYMVLIHNFKGRDLHLIVMIDEDDVSVQVGKKPDRVIHAAVQLVSNYIHPEYKTRSSAFLTKLNSLGDDNSIMARVVPFYSELREDLLKQESRYIENKFDLDLYKNESVFLNLASLLMRYTVSKRTEDYIYCTGEDNQDGQIYSAIDCEVYHLCNVIKSNVIKKDDEVGLVGSFNVLKFENSPKSHSISRSVKHYIENNMCAKELDRFYTEKYVYVITT